MEYANYNRSYDASTHRHAEPYHVHGQFLLVSLGLAFQLHASNHEVGNDDPGEEQDAHKKNDDLLRKDQKALRAISRWPHAA